MDNNNFDFGSDDLLGDASFDTSGSDSFGGFDDQIDFGDNSNQSANLNGASLPDNAFDGQFDSVNADNNNQSQSIKTKKTAIIAIVVGVIGILLVIMIATKLNDMAKKPSTDKSTDSQKSTQQATVTNANDIIGGGPSNTQQQSSQNQVKPVINDGYEFNWKEITGDEDITYADDVYSEKVFSVSEVKHYARSVDINNSRLVTKTVIIGSISGLSGTYTIEIPYSKGVKIQDRLESNQLVEFIVYVKLGDFKGRQVIDDILTYNPN